MQGERCANLSSTVKNLSVDTAVVSSAEDRKERRGDLVDEARRPVDHIERAAGNWSEVSRGARRSMSRTTGDDGPRYVGSGGSQDRRPRCRDAGDLEEGPLSCEDPSNVRGRSRNLAGTRAGGLATR